MRYKRKVLDTSATNSVHAVVKSRLAWAVLVGPGVCLINFNIAVELFFIIVQPALLLSLKERIDIAGALHKASRFI